MSMSGGGGGIEETELERINAEIAMEKFNTLRPQLQQAEDFYIDKVNNIDSDANVRRLTDSINVTTGKQFDETGRAISSNMAARGIDPTSGKFQSTLQAFTGNAGTATADAINRGQTTLQDSALTGKGNLVAMGEGKSAQSITGMMDVANQSSAYANQKAAGEARRSANKEGTLAFMAGAGYEAMDNDEG